MNIDKLHWLNDTQIKLKELSIMYNQELKELNKVKISEIAIENIIEFFEIIDKDLDLDWIIDIQKNKPETRISKYSASEETFFSCFVTTMMAHQASKNSCLMILPLIVTGRPETGFPSHIRKCHNENSYKELGENEYWFTFKHCIIGLIQHMNCYNPEIPEKPANIKKDFKNLFKIIRRFQAIINSIDINTIRYIESQESTTFIESLKSIISITNKKYDNELECIYKIQCLELKNYSQQDFMNLLFLHLDSYDNELNK